MSEAEPSEPMASCLLTTSYDGRLRIWRDLDKAPSIALERKLDSQAPVGSFASRVVPTDAGPQSSDRFRLFVIYAKCGDTLNVVQVPVQSHGESNQPEPVPLFPSGAASASERRRQFMSSDAYVQASDEHIYAATDNGHIVMIRLADVLNPPLMTEQYTNQFGNDIADRPATMYKNIERQIVKIDAVAKRDYEEPIAFRDVPLGCTSLTIYMGYAVFVSDNRGRVHVWTPIYKEREKDEKPTRKSRPTKCVYSGNTEHEPFRPMQNVAADPMGAWLAGTDWSGVNYLWRVKQIVVDKENEQYDYELDEVENWCKNPKPLKQTEPYERAYGLRCVWSPNGEKLAISHSTGNVFIYNRADPLGDNDHVALGQIISAGDISKWVHDVTWNDNGALLITANANGEIRFWEEKEDDKWEEFQQRGKPIKLEDHMIGSSSRTQPNQSTVEPRVVSGIEFTLFPQALFERIRQQKDEEDRQSDQVFNQQHR